MFKIIQRVWDHDAYGMLRYADYYEIGEYATKEDARNKLPKF